MPTEKEREAAAAALGRALGPPDGCSRWAPGYLDKVQWPHDYSEPERKVLRNAAILALEAAESARS